MYGVEDLLVTNTMWRNMRKKKRCKIESCNIDVKEFNKPPKKIFHHDHRGLIVVVCKEDGSTLDIMESGKTTTQQLRDKLNLIFWVGVKHLYQNVQSHAVNTEKLGLLKKFQNLEEDLWKEKNLELFII